MNCPFCQVKLYTLTDGTGYICKKCRTISGSSMFSIRVRDDDVHRFYVTIDSYRLINDKEEDSFALLRQIIQHPKTAGPTYESLYEGKAVNTSPFDIEGLQAYIKTILVFM